MHWIMILIVWTGSGKAITNVEFKTEYTCKAAAQYYNSSTYRTVSMHQSAKCFQK